MTENIHEKKQLQNNTAIQVYYITGMFTIVINFMILIPLVGALISLKTAKKEKNTLAIAHCTWILKSIGFYFLFHVVQILVIVAALYFPFLTSLTHINDILAVPFVGVFFVFFVPMLIFGIWFIFPMVKGITKLNRGELP